nr:LysR family transcriptional regulator [Hyphomonas sp. Mor2]
MTTDPRAFDWNQLRAFIATIDEGSITGAAKALKTTQPTISRQIKSLEDQLGVTLIERGPRGMMLTAPGESLLRDARLMQDAATRISLSASDHSTTAEGSVSVSASEAICLYRLPPIANELRQIAPGIELQILSENGVSDLMRREADIAIRHVRPQQADLIARVILESRAYLYASTEYLDRKGRPNQLSDLRDQDFIGPDNGRSLPEILSENGVEIFDENVRLASNSWATCWELAKQSCGYCLMMKEVGDATPGVERVFSETVFQEMTYWLVSHRELRNNPRIRTVYDLLAKRLSG